MHHLNLMGIHSPGTDPVHVSEFAVMSRAFEIQRSVCVSVAPGNKGCRIKHIIFSLSQASDDVAGWWERGMWFCGWVAAIKSDSLIIRCISSPLKD